MGPRFGLVGIGLASATMPIVGGPSSPSYYSSSSSSPSSPSSSSPSGTLKEHLSLFWTHLRHALAPGILNANERLVANAGLAQFTPVFFLYSLGRNVLRRHDSYFVDRADLTQFLFDFPALCGRLIPILGSDFCTRLTGVISVNSRAADSGSRSNICKIKRSR